MIIMMHSLKHISIQYIIVMKGWFGPLCESGPAVF